MLSLVNQLHVLCEKLIRVSSLLNYEIALRN